jgi:hypothetical protein
MEVFQYLAWLINEMSITNWKTIARGICMWGLFILVWNIFESFTEQSHVATLSNCKTFQENNSTLVIYSKGVTMLQCEATYIIDAKVKTAVLKSQLPDGFNTYTNINIVIQSLSGSSARLASSSRNWEDTLFKVLFFEFIGAMIWLKKN